MNSTDRYCNYSTSVSIPVNTIMVMHLYMCTDTYVLYINLFFVCVVQTFRNVSLFYKTGQVMTSGVSVLAR